MWVKALDLKKLEKIALRLGTITRVLSPSFLKIKSSGVLRSSSSKARKLGRKSN